MGEFSMVSAPAGHFPASANPRPDRAARLVRQALEKSREKAF
jgi:hypothetical protein